MNTYKIKLSEIEHHETLLAITKLEDFINGAKEVFAYSMLNPQFNARMQFQTSESDGAMRLENDLNDLIDDIDIDLRKFTNLSFKIELSKIPYSKNLLTTQTPAQFTNSVKGLFAYALIDPKFKEQMIRKAAASRPRRPHMMVVANDITDRPMHIIIDLTKFDKLPSLKGRCFGTAPTKPPVATPSSSTSSIQKNQSLANITEFTKRA